jgi:MFS family permease
MTCAAMDLGELLEELEWADPAVPTEAVAVHLGDPPEDPAECRRSCRPPPGSGGRHRRVRGSLPDRRPRSARRRSGRRPTGSGLGAAVMMPAALCLLTTSFRSGSDGPRALGVWGGVAGLASAVGVFLGGVLTDGPGSRWVLEVNPPIAVLSLFGIFALIPADASSDRTNGFDVAGAFLITGSMLTLVYTLVKAPDQGWSDARTIIVLTAGAVLLIAFVVVELASRNPLVPLSIFRTPGLATADITQLVGVGGFVTMFFFLTLYMQYVLGFSPLRTGSAYLGLALGVGVSAGIVTGLIGQIGTRPVIVAGALVTSVGPYLLSASPPTATTLLTCCRAYWSSRSASLGSSSVRRPPPMQQFRVAGQPGGGARQLLAADRRRVGAGHLQRCPATSGRFSCWRQPFPGGVSGVPIRRVRRSLCPARDC